MKIVKKEFGTLPGGEKINSFYLQNDNNMSVEILEFGGVVRSINVPDKTGVVSDVVLGYDNLGDYVGDKSYFGATVGRVANRIGGAEVVIAGQKYKLAPNALPDFGYNHLHGGVNGFNRAVWKGVEFQNETEVGVVLTYQSQDGEEGYPGNVDCKLTYTLTNANELKMEVEATTDKTTLVNITHHSYLNLAGEGSGTVLDTKIMLNADRFTPPDDDLIPTGEILEVAGTPLDFRSERTIASQIDEMQMQKYKGYDTNYIINHTVDGTLDLAAKAVNENSGRVLEILTTQPCMHFYTGNFLNGNIGKDGKSYERFGAFCIEPQGFPDAPNKPQFKPVELQPGEKYEEIIIYKFSIIE